jgi:hypothetical protein
MRVIENGNRKLDSKTFFRSLRVVGLLFLSTLSLAGQTPTTQVTDRVVSALSELPEKEQKTGETQRRLQQWFLELVQAYQDSVAKTQAGRSRLVNTGVRALDANSPFRRLLAAPLGKGTYYIVAEKGDSTPRTDGTHTIYLPVGVAGAAAWHEGLHAILNSHSINFDYQAFVPALMYGNDRYKTEDASTRCQHVLMELAAERMLNWIVTLKAFENAAVAAQDRFEELKKKGVVTSQSNYEMENEIWTEASWIWKRVWGADVITSSGKSPQVNNGLRMILESATGVRAPMIEELIGFYMSGEFVIPKEPGLSNPGKKISVPGWVLQRETVEVRAWIDTRGPKGISQLKNNAVEGSLIFAVREARLNRPQVTRGKLSVWLAPPAPKGVSLKVYLRGRELPVTVQPKTNRASVELDLATEKKEIEIDNFQPFKLEIVVQNAGALTGAGQEVVIPVHISYTDSPPKGQTNLYEPTEGIYLFKLMPQNTATPQTPVKTPPTPTAPTRKSALPVLNESLLGGAWKVTNPGELNLPAYSTVNWTAYIPDKINLQVFATLYRSEFDAEKIWNNSIRTMTPAKTAYGNKTYIFEDGAGAVKLHALYGKLTRVSIEGSRYDTTVSPAEVTRAAYQILAVLDKQIKATPSQALAPTIVQAVITAEWADKKPSEFKDDPRLDNLPPEIGAMIPIHEDVYLFPAAKTAPKWFTHAEGFYRFQIPGEWEVIENRAGAGLDRIVGKSSFLIVEVNRSHTKIAQPDVAYGMILQGLLKSDPQTRTFDLNYGGAPVKVFAQRIKAGEAEMSAWHLLFYNGGNLYQLSVIAPLSSAPQKIPAQMQEALKTLQFLKK